MSNSRLVVFLSFVRLHADTFNHVPPQNIFAATFCLAPSWQFAEEPDLSGFCLTQVEVLVLS